ncbi:unnamed protein product, partial [Prorocentrum cordatum]
DITWAKIPKAPRTLRAWRGARAQLKSERDLCTDAGTAEPETSGKVTEAIMDPTTEVHRVHMLTHELHLDTLDDEGRTKAVGELL